MRGQALALLQLAVWAAGQAAAAGCLRAATALEHHDNPFAEGESRRAAWVSRLHFSGDGALVDRPRLAVQVRHHCGVKRFWTHAPARRRPGGIVANQIEVQSAWQPHRRCLVDAQTSLKAKNVQRVPGEESYLRGVLGVGLTACGPHGVAVRASLDAGVEDARDTLLVDIAQRALGAQVSRRWASRGAVEAGVRWRRLRYDQPAWKAGPGGGIVAAGSKQLDESVEWTADGRLGEPLLACAGYARIRSDSNSLGYAYRAHRFQLVLARHVCWGFDAHAHATAQFRTYPEDIPGAIDPGSRAQDEYAQKLVSVRLDRRLTARHTLSGEYRWSRNGSVGSAGSCRNRVWSMALDMLL